MLDRAIIHFDRALRTVFAPAATTRALPGGDLPDTVFDETERMHAAALMRVNHCGEICAQALYQGQSLTCRDDGIRRELERASAEETEHLAWTERRIAELGGRKSLLNPFWYAGSFALGAIAGKLGDRWNLGFLAETERQVEAHLDGHLNLLPAGDEKSRAILEQMKADERRHADVAVKLGANELPPTVKNGMRLMSRIMTTLARRF